MGPNLYSSLFCLHLRASARVDKIHHMPDVTAQFHSYMAIIHEVS